MDIRKEYFECQCYSDEHRLVFSLDVEAGYEPILECSAFLADFPAFWARLWAAIRYVFGYKSKYGHFDSFMMRPEDVERFKRLISEYQCACLAKKWGPLLNSATNDYATAALIESQQQRVDRA